LRFSCSKVKDGNDLEEIDKAITTAKSQEGPTIIEVKTTIGFGSPNKAGTNASIIVGPS
jgi:transketolase